MQLQSHADDTDFESSPTIISLAGSSEDSPQSKSSQNGDEDTHMDHEGFVSDMEMTDISVTYSLVITQKDSLRFRK